MMTSVWLLLPMTFDPCSSTVPEALTKLRILREDLENMVELLHHRLESQKETSECMRIRMVLISTPCTGQSEDPEHAAHSVYHCVSQKQELRLQEKHLRTERDQALKSVKERLIQV